MNCLGVSRKASARYAACCRELVPDFLLKAKGVILKQNQILTQAALLVGSRENTITLHLPYTTENINHPFSEIKYCDLLRKVFNF